MRTRGATRRSGFADEVALWALALLALALVAAGCGSRQSHETLEQALRGNPSAGPDARGSGAAVRTGGSADNSSSTAVVDGSGGSTGASGGGGATGGSGADGGAGAVDGSGAGGAAVGAAGQSCPGSLSTIAIGSVGEISGIIGGIIGGGIKTMQAWVQAVNDAGGLNCHPVKFFIADSQADPARQQSLVQKMVEEDHVIAFVYMVSPISGQASVDYLTSRQIPVIGNEDAEFWFYDSPMYFPQMSSGDEMLKAIFAAGGYARQSTGGTKLAATSCVEVPLCSNFYKMAPIEAPKYGLELVYNSQVTIVAPDYTSNCQAAQRAGAQIMLAGVDPNSVLRMARSCASVNYHPVFLVGAPIATPLLLSDPRLEGTLAGITNIPFFETSNPSVAEFHSVLARYAAGVEPDVNGMSAWAAAKLFEVATQNISEPPTSESILEGLWSIKDNDLGGITQPLTFTRGQTAPRVFCYWLVQISGGTYVSPNESQRQCG